jgi:outer membrane protein TolC
MTPRSAAVLLALLAFARPGAAAAQGDTLRLAALQDAAVRRDPRAAQALMQARATELRLRNLDAERLPRLEMRGEATRQSEVASIPISLPGGAAPPEPPKSRIEGALEAQYTLYDGGVLDERRRLERVRLQTAQAQLAAQLHPLRMEVTEAFFAAFLLQERMAEVGTLMEDLEARLDLVRAQVRGGAALPGDTAALRAELLGAAQQRAELAADRRAALAVLGQLAGRAVGEADVLALPELGGVPAADEAPAHPQYAVFAAERERLAREDALVQARTRPQVAAFGQLAYGRPGPAQFREDLHEWWMGGVRVRWQPWDWGVAARDRDVLRVQRQIVDTEEAAFGDRLRREVQDEVAAIGRLRDALATDDRVVALREQVERQARVQLEERVITPAVYVDARTDLQEARLTRQRHRAELARAMARYLTTLGREL